MKDNIYISSLAFKGKSAGDIIDIAANEKWAIEFTSSFSYDILLEKLFLDASIKRMPHNYFPLPEIPFVLNLASSNEDIRKKSIEHCCNGLKLSKKVKAPFYAAHAGFCIDPNPEELGKQINVAKVFDRDDNWQLFIESIQAVLTVAEQEEIDFLIENNVIAPFNFRDNVNPLLCCESNEISRLFKEVKHDHFGLLLDTAHLKVSCKTLGLELKNELRAIHPYIKGIHHSDNNGLVDNNQSLDQHYWFLPFVSGYKHLPNVIEVNNLGNDEIYNHINLLEQYAS